MNRTSRHAFLPGFAALALLVLASACSTVPTPNSPVPPPPGALSYELRQPSWVRENLLRDQETIQRIRTALNQKGMYEAPSGTKPDLNVFVDFGISSRIVRQKVTEPVFPSAEVALLLGDGPTSYRDVIVSRTVYEKYLRLNAVDAGWNLPGRPLHGAWAVEVISEGGSRDLQQALPRLVAASSDYIGKYQPTQSNIRLKDRLLPWVD